MTMPYGSIEEPVVPFVMGESLPVRVVSSDQAPTKDVGTEFGSWRTVYLSATSGESGTPSRARLCSRSPRRKRLLIACFATIAAQPVIDGVILGSRDFCTNSAGIVSPYVAGLPGGGFIPIGQSLRWECQGELWAAYPPSNANPVLVTVCDEQYASD